MMCRGFMLLESKRESNFFDVCSGCKGNCCRNARPPLTFRRKQIIEAYLKEHQIPSKNPFFHAAYIFPKDSDEGYCIFYDKETRRCLVHPVKPETCVAGPITFDINMKSQKIEWYLKKEEICSLAGAIRKNREELRKHLESAKKEILTLIRELDSRALKDILKIEEPESFKIDEDDLEKGILDKLTK